MVTNSPLVPQHGKEAFSLPEKRTLQLCVALAGTVAVLAGAWGVFDGPHANTVGLTSHERYLSGLLLAIGLAFWSTLSDIEHKTGQFRLLCALVVIGGLCRLVGVATGDGLSWSIMGALLMELIVAPVLCLWQSRLGPAALVAKVWRPF
jgi:uncharacterized membrane protein YfcA